MGRKRNWGATNAGSAKIASDAAMAMDLQIEQRLSSLSSRCGRGHDDLRDCSQWASISDAKTRCSRL